MKKLALQITGAVLVWTAVFALCLRFCGGGLTLYFEVPPDATDMKISSAPEGIIRAEELEISADSEEIAVHFSSIKTGNASVRITWEGVGGDSLYADSMDMEMRSLPFGILTDSITWNFTGWEYMTACLSGLLLTLSLIFYIASGSERKRRYFSYRATGELGLAIFFLVTAFFRIDMLLAFARGRNAGTVWSLLVGTIVSAQTFMRRTAAILVAFAVLAAISNIVLMRYEGFRPSNMLGILAAVFMVGGAAFGIWMSYSLVMFPMRNVLVNVYAGVFVYLECLLTATIIHAVMAGRHEPEYDSDYVLILGCRIRPDGSLYPLIRGRVDRAITFYHKQSASAGKPPVLVPSGGKGEDEPEAEADAMARYLREQGIPEKDILIENRSKTTLENLSFSKQLIDQSGSDRKAVFCTSSYHVYRGGILASERGWDIDGMGSRTKWYFWPNAFLREFAGLLSARRAQQFAAIAVIVTLSTAFTILVM